MTSDSSSRRPHSRVLPLIGGVAVVGLLGAGPRGETPTPPIRTDAVAQVRALAKAMYPALTGQNLPAQIVSDLYVDTDPLPLTQFRYSIRPGTAAGQRQAVVHVIVDDIDADGRIAGCSASGAFVNTARFFEVVALLDAHPAWSETQDIEALRAAGAAFGPWNRDAFLAQTIPRLRELGPHWGRLTTWTAAFDMRYRGGEQPQPVISWIVEVTLTSGRRAGRYRFRFEPFEGKLTSVVKDRW